MRELKPQSFSKLYECTPGEFETKIKKIRLFYNDVVRVVEENEKKPLYYRVLSFDMIADETFSYTFENISENMPLVYKLVGHIINANHNISGFF